MATIKLYNNVFENEYKEFSYDESKSLCENIESHVDEDIYKETLVECYDSETGKTFYAPIEEENGSVLILVNQKSVDKDFIPKNTDVVSGFKFNQLILEKNEITAIDENTTIKRGKYIFLNLFK